jgi:negative regulator of flagellin synthesis FlgM
MPDPIRGVDGSNPITPASPSAAGQAGAAASTEAAANAAVENAAASGAAGDSADVGQTEALLQNIIRAASSTPGIDQAKVAELQQAIASGAYQSNPQSIAQKLVELESLLGTAGQVQ